MVGRYIKATFSRRRCFVAMCDVAPSCCSRLYTHLLIHYIAPSSVSNLGHVTWIELNWKKIILNTCIPMRVFTAHELYNVMCAWPINARSVQLKFSSIHVLWKVNEALRFHWDRSGIATLVVLYCLSLPKWKVTPQNSVDVYTAYAYYSFKVQI